MAEDKVSYPYKTRKEQVYVYCMFMSLMGDTKSKDSELNGSQELRTSFLRERKTVKYA
jgi:hypothetical protein